MNVCVCSLLLILCLYSIFYIFSLAREHCILRKVCELRTFVVCLLVLGLGAHFCSVRISCILGRSTSRVNERSANTEIITATQHTHANLHLWLCVSVWVNIRRSLNSNACRSFQFYFSAFFFPFRFGRLSISFPLTQISRNEKFGSFVAAHINCECVLHTIWIEFHQHTIKTTSCVYGDYRRDGMLFIVKNNEMQCRRKVEKISLRSV